MSMSVSAYQNAIMGVTPKRPSKGLILGIGIALGLHVLFALFLINQQFLIPATEPLASEPPTDLTFYKPPVAEPEKPLPREKVVTVHEPLAETPIQTETLPVPPQTQASNEGTLPATVSTTVVTQSTAVTAPEARYVKGVWKFPTSDAMVDLYPARAVENEVEGTVTIDCAINGAGHIKACDIVSETPKGYGFGKATVTAFLKYATVKPSSVDGQLQDGDRRRFTYQWTLK